MPPPGPPPPGAGPMPPPGPPPPGASMPPEVPPQTSDPLAPWGDGPGASLPSLPPVPHDQTSAGSDYSKGQRNSHLLRQYLQQHYTRDGWGLGGTRAMPVANFQTAVGIPTTGSVDAATRATAAKYGVQLPRAPAGGVVAPIPHQVTESTATRKQAAQLLNLFLSKNPTAAAFGFKGAPSRPVQQFQRKFGLTIDGIVGPDVRGAAASEGVSLPARPAQGAAAAPAVSSATERQRKADAALLNQYLRSPGADFGTVENPSRAIARAQAALGVATVDGIVGPETYAAAKRYGQTLPLRSTPSKTQWRTLETDGQTRAREAQAESIKRAAHLLRMYLSQNAAKAKAFGYKGAPSKPVRSFQSVARIAADGIVGPETRAAAKAVGVTLPPRPVSQDSATVQQAARLLAMWLAQNQTAEAYGYRGRPSTPVANFQRKAGIKVDGIFGLQTRTAAKAVGVDLPVRPR